MRYIVAEFSKLVEDDIGRIARELGAFFVDLLYVALRAWGPDDVLRLGRPAAQPLEPLLAHALGQYGYAAAAENTRDRDATAAIISGRRPYGLVKRRVEAARHQARYQAAIGGEHFVRGDHRKQATERQDNRRANAGQLGRQQKILRGRGKAGPRPVVVPVHAKEVGRLRAIGVDGAQRGSARLRNTRGVGKLREGRQPNSGATQPPRGAITHHRVDDCRDNPTAHLRAYLNRGQAPTLANCLLSLKRQVRVTGGEAIVRGARRNSRARFRALHRRAVCDAEAGSSSATFARRNAPIGCFM